MCIPDYTNFLEKISFIEGTLRMAENYNDPLPLQFALRDPEMDKIVKSHFNVSNSNEFIKLLFSENKNFKQVLSDRFSGAKILFHTRKHHSEHTLPNTQLIYCVRGECFVRVDSREICLTEGMSCLIGVNVPHSYYNASERSITLHIVLTKSFVSSILFPHIPQDGILSVYLKNIIFEDCSTPSYVYIPASNPAETTYFLTSAFYHNLTKNPMSEELTNTFITLFFTFQAQNINNTATTVYSSSPETTIQNILDFISINCRSVTLSQLSKTFHFNESYMSQFLKKHTGEKFTTLLQRSRITLAEKLLVNSNFSIVEIADKVGYQNVSYFYKIFTKVNNCSPAEYRSQFLSSNTRVIGRETT